MTPGPDKNSIWLRLTLAIPIRGDVGQWGYLMKIKLFTVAAAVSLLVSGGAASAAITITSEAAGPGNAALSDGVADGQALPGVPGEVMIDNFGDNGGPQTPLAGFSFAPQVFVQGGGSAGYIRNGAGPPQLLSGESAPPPLADGSYETGNYYTVTSDGGTNTATLTVTKGYLTEFSFYLGSPDAYNSVAFFGADGQIGDTLSGNAIWACPSCGQSGDQTFGARAIYNFGGAQVTSITFTSSGNSFEFDNLAGTIAGVPEPASWALMTMGFGAAGAMARSRRKALAA
jgi:hypothetical protein